MFVCELYEVIFHDFYDCLIWFSSSRYVLTSYCTEGLIFSDSNRSNLC